ncbi:MAG: hypothetical protein K9M10_02740 [Candidatus Pacebacteria bacterium]|nr:hypothetical protein [Candidatus Paceibacterota bacterium]MCF7857371.1 hypothetical protein [Candidatus Paceibacterota bacterium]
MEHSPKFHSDKEELSKPVPYGREALSVESALVTQIALMRHMIPSELRKFMSQSDGVHVSAEDFFFEKWQKKYAIPFSDYCDIHADDTELIERMQNQELKPEDIQTLHGYLEGEALERPFFTQEEKDEFMRRNVH